MARKYFTMQELESLRLYEMPNMAYDAILDQFIDLYSIIQVI